MYASFNEISPLTSAEKAADIAAKRNRQKEDERIAFCLKWRDIDRNVKCFPYDEVAPVDAWATFNIPKRDASLSNIFKSFITNDIIANLSRKFSDTNPLLGVRNYSTSQKRIVIDNKKVWQSFAIYIYICAKGNRASEVRTNGKFMRTAINDARKYFMEQVGIETIGRETIEKLLTMVLLTKEYTPRISENFVSILMSLGQYVAGDEKLFIMKLIKRVKVTQYTIQKLDKRSHIIMIHRRGWVRSITYHSD